MCGIGGFINFNLNCKLNEDSLRKISKSIRHRGPDDNGDFFTGQVGLCNRRLSIQDLSKNASMPIFDKINGLVLTYNGEIYNFKELKKKLLKKGYRFNTNSDSEVVLALYKYFGEKFTDYLNGMFAIAIWDIKKKKLILVRDKIGKKPLYYYFDENFFIFSSELSSFISLKEKLNLEIDFEALNQYFVYGNFPSPYTIFKKIKKLDSSHILILSDKKLEIKKYYEFYIEKKKTELDYDYKDFDKLIVDSVSKRLISDAPVGILLSGGIDSSIISIIASRISKKKIDTFSVKFNEPNYDESKYSNFISKKIESNHHQIEFSAKNLIKNVYSVMSSFDEPFSDTSAIPTYLISKYVSKTKKVVLSGDGGDELFFGYNNYLQFIESFKKREFYDGFLNKLLINLDFLAHKDDVFKKADKKLWSKYYYKYQARVPEKIRKKLISDISTDDYVYMKNIMTNIKNQNIVSVFSYSDFFNYLQNDILVKTDRMGMKNGLEIRAPFLDETIVNFSMKLSSKIKFNKNNLKGFLKGYLKSILDCEEVNQIINRKKKGFRFPIEIFIKNENQNIKNKILSKDFLDYFNFEKETIENNIIGKKKIGKTLWLLFCLYLWWEKKIK